MGVQSLHFCLIKKHMLCGWQTVEWTHIEKLSKYYSDTFHDKAQGLFTEYLANNVEGFVESCNINVNEDLKTLIFWLTEE